jgi:Flp pilus assembly pilin Flp
MKKGQSILEYIIVITAIIAIVILAANGVIKNAVNNAMTNAASTITNVSSKLP